MFLPSCSPVLNLTVCSAQFEIFLTADHVVITITVVMLPKFTKEMNGQLYPHLVIYTCL